MKDLTPNPSPRGEGLKNKAPFFGEPALH